MGSGARGGGSGVGLGPPFIAGHPFPGSACTCGHRHGPGPRPALSPSPSAGPHPSADAQWLSSLTISCFQGSAQRRGREGPHWGRGMRPRPWAVSFAHVSPSTSPPPLLEAPPGSWSLRLSGMPFHSFASLPQPGCVSPCPGIKGDFG